MKKEVKNQNRPLLKVFLFFILLTQPVVLQALDQDPLVEVTKVIQDVMIDVRYATADNFLKKAVYPAAAVFLKKSTAEKLKKADDDLRQQGYRLKIFDGYRPLSVQRQMWAIMPKPGYVADPAKGSMHNRGGAVDLTLVTLDGKEIEMPSEYDEFTLRAHHNNPLSSPASIKNANILKAAMKKAGFQSIRTEWWHYQDPNLKRAPLLDIPLEELVKQEKD